MQDSSGFDWIEEQGYVPDCQTIQNVVSTHMTQYH